MHEVPEEAYILDISGGEDYSGHFHIDCAYCQGTGVDPTTMKSLTHSRCPVCNGVGMRVINGRRQDTITCQPCGGTGREPDSKTIMPCHTCRGWGIL